MIIPILLYFAVGAAVARAMAAWEPNSVGDAGDAAMIILIWPLVLVFATIHALLD